MKAEFEANKLKKSKLVQFEAANRLKKSNLVQFEANKLKKSKLVRRYMWFIKYFTSSPLVLLGIIYSLHLFFVTLYVPLLVVNFIVINKI